ncbi:hypothetical protein L873DRAFT_118686 [Choiromyces venosus 120613-1]|uniref:Uncharacterized protein n=1 Tax=Choiromyces venosus 120613-1 TaxID=1336337 RepID=A0A3N4J961_9PEZI|nr:hypothetical protein L873DRAFT_118686 [Choiromyces venosus 120613-1]
MAHLASAFTVFAFIPSMVGSTALWPSGFRSFLAWFFFIKSRLVVGYFFAGLGDPLTPIKRQMVVTPVDSGRCSVEGCFAVGWFGLARVGCEVQRWHPFLFCIRLGGLACKGGFGLCTHVFTKCCGAPEEEG